MGTEYSLLSLIALSVVFQRDLSILLSYLGLSPPAAGHSCVLNREHTQMFTHHPDISVSVHRLIGNYLFPCLDEGVGLFVIFLVGF